MLANPLFLILGLATFAEAAPPARFTQALADNGLLLEESKTAVREAFRAPGAGPHASAGPKFEKEFSAIEQEFWSTFAPLQKDLGNADCFLPSPARISSTRIDLHALQIRVSNLDGRLAREAGFLDADPMVREGSATPFRTGVQKVNSNLGFFIKSLAEIERWIALSTVEGPTSEMIARNPRCAGRVTARRLLRPLEDPEVGTHGGSTIAQDFGARNLASPQVSAR